MTTWYSGGSGTEWSGSDGCETYWDALTSCNVQSDSTVGPTAVLVLVAQVVVVEQAPSARHILPLYQVQSVARPLALVSLPGTQ